MLRRLPAIVLTVMIVEILVFYQIAAWAGGSTVLLLCLITFWIGITMIRRTKESVASEAMRIFQNPSVSTTSFSSPLFRYFSAFLLIVPGFITDLIAVLLFVPTIRNLFTVKVAHPARSFSPTGSGTHSEYQSVEEKAQTDRKKKIDIQDVEFEDLPL